MFSYPKWFSPFLEPDCDRCSFIQEQLSQSGINSNIIKCGNHNHIFVQFSPSAYNGRFKLKTVVAHYDRVAGTSGANDNSSGVFALIEFARRLVLTGASHNIRIIFTDAEEEGRFGIKGQGAFGLSKLLNSQRTYEDLVFVIDSIGRGQVPVLAKTQLPLNTDKNFAGRFNFLFDTALNLLKEASPCSNFVLPAAFSDNAGFMANGIPAVCITMLPSKEATDYVFNLKRIPELEASVMNRSLEKDIATGTPEYILKEKLPLTWKLFHTQYDVPSTLDGFAFDLTARILDKIRELCIPV